jgi:protein SCO1/2
MKPIVLVIGCFLFSSSAAQSGIVTAQLQEIRIAPAPDARVPLESLWQDENGASTSLDDALGGRPTLLIFADYTCNTLCSPILSFVDDALSKSGLTPADYRLVVLGIDPKDGPREATIMKQQRIADDAVASAAIFLTADETTIRGTADAVGYRFTYDAERDQFAHPAAVLVLTSDGHVTRVLSALGIGGDDFRLALVEAGQGRIGTFGDQVRLLCYGFDPSIGIYTVSVYRALAFAAALTATTMAIGIGWLSVRSPRAS